MTEISDFLDPLSSFTRAILLAIIFIGLWLALNRTSWAFASRLRVWSVLSAITLVWFGAAYTLGRQGFFQPVPGAAIPTIPFAIVIPVAIGLFLLIRSATITRLIDATPVSWLIGVQFYRVLGVVFLMHWTAGNLPDEFALPAGIGDILVGLIALPVAYAVARGARAAMTAAYVWNGFGILDLVVAVATGFLSSPGPLQMLAFENPNTLVTAYPLVMIPAFAVPLSLILHGLCIWKLRRLAAYGHNTTDKKNSDIGEETATTSAG